MVAMMAGQKVAELAYSRADWMVVMMVVMMVESWAVLTVSMMVVLKVRPSAVWLGISKALMKADSKG